MVVGNSLVSFFIVACLFLYLRTLPDDMSASQAGGTGFFALPFLAVASALSLVALVAWIRRIRKKRYTHFLHYLAIAPSIPIFVIWAIAGAFFFRQLLGK